MRLHEYRVGELYNPDRTSWEETPSYQFRGGQHELVLFYRSPSVHEIREIRNGLARFAFHIEEDVLLFLFQFGDLNWADSPFSWHLVQSDERVFPTPLENERQRMVLTILLVDADSGILRALRLVSFTPEFTRVIQEAILKQAEAPFNESSYNSAVDRIYRRYPTAEAISKVAAHHCVGGRP